MCGRFLCVFFLLNFVLNSFVSTSNHVIFTFLTNLLQQQVQATTVIRRTHKSTFCHFLSQSPSFLFATWNQRSEIAYKCHRISATDSKFKTALPNVLIRSGNERVHDNNCLGKGNLRLHYVWGRHIMITKATNNMRNCRLTEPSSRNLAK